MRHFCEAFNLPECLVSELRIITACKILNPVTCSADYVMVIVFGIFQFVVGAILLEVHLDNQPGFLEHVKNSIDSNLINVRAAHAVDNSLNA